MIISMKTVKVLSLCMVMLVGSMSLFAQDAKKGDRPERGDKGQRSERIVSELNLNDQQAAEFKKIEEDFSAKMKTQREAMKAAEQKNREEVKTMIDEKDAAVKKILTEEQYKQYTELSKRGKKHGPAPRGEKGKRPAPKKQGGCGCNK
jgi:Spy/CpxP family protein refolding chaperone